MIKGNKTRTLSIVYKATQQVFKSKFFAKQTLKYWIIDNQNYTLVDSFKSKLCCLNSKRLIDEKFVVQYLKNNKIEDTMSL